MIWGAFQLDQKSVDFLARPISSGQTKNVLRNLRTWGEGTTVVVLSIGWLFAAPKRWRVPVGMMIASLGVGILVEVVKPYTNRARPAYALNPQTAAESDRSSSFPSGHAATAFAFARMWSFAMPAARPICLLAATGTGVSRMYEQRHYLSDCVVGGLLGWYFSTLIGWGMNRLLGPKGIVPESPEETPEP